MRAAVLMYMVHHTDMKAGYSCIHAKRQRHRMDQIVFNILTLVNRDRAGEFESKLTPFLVDLRTWGYGGADKQGDRLQFVGPAPAQA
eukprot:14743-Heterococcus_DN1.PRE.5